MRRPGHVLSRSGRDRAEFQCGCGPAAGQPAAAVGARRRRPDQGLTQDPFVKDAVRNRCHAEARGKALDRPARNQRPQSGPSTPGGKTPSRALVRIRTTCAKHLLMPKGPPHAPRFHWAIRPHGRPMELLPQAPCPGHIASSKRRCGRYPPMQHAGRCRHGRHPDGCHGPSGSVQVLGPARPRAGRIPLGASRRRVPHRPTKPAPRAAFLVEHVPGSSRGHAAEGLPARPSLVNPDAPWRHRSGVQPMRVEGDVREGTDPTRRPGQPSRRG
jgi:hypothetical protein